LPNVFGSFCAFSSENVLLCAISNGSAESALLYEGENRNEECVSNSLEYSIFFGKDIECKVEQKERRVNKSAISAAKFMTKNAKRKTLLLTKYLYREQIIFVMNPKQTSCI